MIIVDSRGAGEGKTTTGIYPRIDFLKSLSENILLVVPSKHLQDQYENHFVTSDFVKINSEQSDSVCSSIINTLSTRSGIIVCITHEAFMRLSIPLTTKKKWHLIIDEAFNPFRTVVWESKKNSIDWSGLIKLPDGVLLDDNVPFIQVETNSEQDDSWTAQVREIQCLMNRDWETYCKVSSYKKLQNSEAGRAEFIQSLSISRIRYWKSVYVAAAAFEQTFMYHWIKFNHEQINVVHPFKKRELPIRLHCPEDLDWSKYKQDNMPEIHSRYVAYVESVCESNGSNPLAVRNNSSKQSLANEVKLNHNPHGLNQFTEYTSVSLETALNPSNVFKEWLVQIMDMNDKSITSSFSSYMFYQILMRTALRLSLNEKPVDVFLLDSKTAYELFNYFNMKSDDIIPMDLGVKKKIPLTSAQRKARWRAKQVQNKQ